MLFFAPQPYETYPFDSYYIQEQQRRQAQARAESERRRAYQLAILQRQHEIEARRAHHHRIQELERQRRLRELHASKLCNHPLNPSGLSCNSYDEESDDDEELEEEFLLTPFGFMRRSVARTPSTPRPRPDTAQLSTKINHTPMNPSPASVPVQIPLEDKRSPESQESVIPLKVSPEPNPVDQEKLDRAASRIQRAYRVHRSLLRISSLSSQVQDLHSKFSFPSSPSFSPGPTPKLAYDPNNRPVHAFEHELTLLLESLDSVPAYQSKTVRDARKAVIARIDELLGDLDEQKRRAWMASRSPSLNSDSDISLDDSSSNSQSVSLVEDDDIEEDDEEEWIDAEDEINDEDAGPTGGSHPSLTPRTPEHSPESPKDTSRAEDMKDDDLIFV